MKATSAPRRFRFHSRLERLAEGINYFAFPVPAKITAALGTRGPVPVTARVKGGTPFLISLFPRGGGRHFLRVKESVRREAKLTEGDRADVQIAVRDRAADVALPPDLARALRAAGVLAAFQALPLGKRSYAIRRINEAAKPATRAKRIQASVAEAQL